MSHYETREDEIHATLKSYIKERNTIEVMLNDLDDMHEHTPKQAAAYESLQSQWGELDQAIGELRTHL